MPLYKNPLNLKIFLKVQEIIGWNVEPDSLICDLPVDDGLVAEIEKTFSVTLRDHIYKVNLIERNWQTVRDLVGDIDAQYTRNYFISESGTYKGLIEVEDHKGRQISEIPHKWQLRGKNLIDRLRAQQEKNPDLTILDLGCGYNLYKNHLKNVTGVDPYIEDADYVCRVEDFCPPEQYDVIICFGPMNWYTFDLQVRNMRKIKECLKPEGVCYWSHVHNYYKIFQPDAQRAHRWIAGSLEDAFKNNAFYFFDHIWTYNNYFNWTEDALERICEKVALRPGKMQYDDCGCYRPPVWRLFCELGHS